MATVSELQDDPTWTPHAIDAATKTVEFIRIPNSALTQPGFLFEFEPEKPSDRQRATFEQVAQMRPVTVPLHFIFHTAFCRSTLLTRALNITGVSSGLSEPAIFAAIANADEEAKPLIPALLNLLARARDEEKVVFAKPTNHANRIIPRLLDASPSSRAILMTNDLPGFLSSIRKRGLLGRRWGRELFLEMQSYAGIDFQMNARESFAMTDMQAAGLAWFLNQNFFQSIQKSTFADRVRVLDGDRFNSDRAATLKAVLEFTEVELSDVKANRAASSEIFESHAKLGGRFVDVAQDIASNQMIDEQEADQVAHWLSYFAHQLGLDIPIAHTLT